MLLINNKSCVYIYLTVNTNATIIFYQLKKWGEIMAVPFWEWMCEYCGTKRIMAENVGMPRPDKCPKASKYAPAQVHKWVKTRRVK